MRTYGNDWLRRFKRSRCEGLYDMGYWPCHAPRLNRKKATNAQRIERRKKHP